MISAQQLLRPFRECTGVYILRGESHWNGYHKMCRSPRRRLSIDQQPFFPPFENKQITIRTIASDCVPFFVESNITLPLSKRQIEAQPDRDSLRDHGD